MFYAYSNVLVDLRLLKAMLPSGPMANRRFLVFLVAVVGFISLISLVSRQHGTDSAFSNVPIHRVSVDDSVLKGEAIAGKIGNETLK